MTNDKPVLIVGLGNPGAEYAMTRHNAGFIAIDSIAGDDAVWKKEKKSLTTRHSPLTTHHSPFMILAKPQTFMNDSGTSVAALMAYYKIPLENLIVIHDDMDIKQGNIRVKTGGGSAGHNGIKSIDAMVGPDYKRIRVGIGHPRDFNSPVSPHDWVLARFSKEDMKDISSAIEKAKLEIGNL